MKQRTRLVALVGSTLVLGHCVPDLDSLQAGGGGCSGANCGGAGGAHSGGGGHGGSGGGERGGSAGAAGAAGASGGTLAMGGAAGSAGTAGQNTAGASGGAAGEPAGGSSAGGAANGGTSEAGSGGVGGASGGCVTTFPGDILYAFNNASSVYKGSVPNPSGTLPGGFFGYAEPNGSAALSTSTTDWSPTEGHSCPGALTATVQFAVYGASEKLLVLTNFNANWASPKAYTALHAWIKLVIPPEVGSLDYLQGVQFAVNTNNFTEFMGTTAPASTFANGDWQEMTLPLVPSTQYSPTSVNQIGVQLIAKAVAPASPPAPVATTMYVDDIWLEGP